MLDSQIRGSEFTVVAHGLRDLADRLENSERRAQQAISTINQSVSALGDRIDAAERVKQLADVAFTSAADALAQAARDQAVAFDSLETTVRNIQSRMGDIERSATGLASKDNIQRLEQGVTDLKSQFKDAERKSSEAANAFENWQRSLNQRIEHVEQTLPRYASAEGMARIENVLSTLKADVNESNARARDEFGSLTSFVRDLGSRIDKAERALGGGTAGPRLDALDARQNALTEEMRQALATMDSRIAQAATGAASGELQGLKKSVEDVTANMAALTGRLDSVADPSQGPMGSVQSSLEGLATKIEESDKRAAESVATISNVLKTISARLDEADKRQAQTAQALTRRLDEAERRSADSQYAVEDAIKALTQRVDAAEKKHKEAVAGLRLTVDGLVARAAADALPSNSALAQATIAASSLSGPAFGTSALPSSLTNAAPPPPASFNVPPPSAVAPPPPPAFTVDLPPPVAPAPPKLEDGMTVSALQTILAGTLSAPPIPDTPSSFDPGKFAPEAQDAPLAEQAPPKKDDFMAQARRAAQAAAQAETEKASNKRHLSHGERLDAKPLNVGRLLIISLAVIALVAGILALVMTYPSGTDDEANRPAPGSSIGEMLNGTSSAPANEAPAPAAAEPTSAAPSFTPLPPPPSEENRAAEETPAAAEPAAPNFTAGAPALPGATPTEGGGDAQIASLETAANSGDVKAQFVLALRYAEGRGVTKDEAKAAALVTKSANGGLVVAQYRLGALYERGIGLPKNLAEARKWYEKAAVAGNRKAMHNLAVLYADGTGVGQNFTEAAKWFKQGATYGVTDSQYNLAVLYERGMGVEKSLSEAAKWFAIAAGQGDADAGNRLEALKKQMNPGEVAAALEGARNYKPKPIDPAFNEVPTVAGG